MMSICEKKKLSGVRLIHLEQMFSYNLQLYTIDNMLTFNEHANFQWAYNLCRNASYKLYALRK